jgi:hypothetical protein
VAPSHTKKYSVDVGWRQEISDMFFGPKIGVDTAAFVYQRVHLSVCARLEAPAFPLQRGCIIIGYRSEGIVLLCDYGLMVEKYCRRLDYIIYRIFIMFKNV